MSRFPHHFLRVWLILSLLVLPLDASLAAAAMGELNTQVQDMSVSMGHSSGMDHATMDHQTMNDECPCPACCADGDCDGLSHCASGHCSVVALANTTIPTASPQVSGQITSPAVSIFTLIFPPAHRPPIVSLV